MKLYTWIGRFKKKNENETKATKFFPGCLWEYLYRTFSKLWKKMPHLEKVETLAYYVNRILGSIDRNHKNIGSSKRNNCQEFCWSIIRRVPAQTLWKFIYIWQNIHCTTHANGITKAISFSELINNSLKIYRNGQYRHKWEKIPLTHQCFKWSIRPSFLCTTFHNLFFQPHTDFLVLSKEICSKHSAILAPSYSSVNIICRWSKHTFCINESHKH